MADVLHTAGLDQVNGSTPLRALLLVDTATPTSADVFVADVVADELGSAGYARVTSFTGATRTVNSSPDRLEFSYDPPNFGTAAAGDDYRWLTLYKFITNDAASLLIASIDLGVLTTDGLPIVLPALNDILFTMPGG